MSHTRDTISEQPALSRRDFLVVGGTAGTAALLASSCDSRGGNTLPEKRLPAITGLDLFEVSEATIQKVMTRAMSRGGSYCDLYFQKKNLVWLGLEDSAVNKAYTRIEMGVGVRVVDGTQTGYAFTESLDEGSMLAAAEIASAVAAGAPGKPPRSFNASKKPSYYASASVWTGVNPAKKVGILKDLESKILAKDPRIKKALISFNHEESSILHIDSLGRTFTDFQPMTVIGVSCVAEEKGHVESNGYNMAMRAGMEFYTQARLQKIADEAVRRTLVLFKAVPGPVGEYPLVMSPGSSGILLHEAIGHGMEADFARKKITIYTDMIGKKVAPKFVNIFDDGTWHGLRGSINIDDEGCNSQKTQLVENGVFRSFLHDTMSAKHFALAPTGNGRRESFKHMPIPRMRNTYMTNGPHTPEQIVRSIKKGIYAETFTNGQVMIGAGDFTFYVKTGYLIEDGKITAPIKDVNIIGNGPKVLADIKMVGNDFKMDEGGWTCGKAGQGVPVGLGMPTVKVGKITVGGTSKMKKSGALIDFSNSEVTA